MIKKGFYYLFHLWFNTLAELIYKVLHNWILCTFKIIKLFCMYFTDFNCEQFVQEYLVSQKKYAYSQGALYWISMCGLKIGTFRCCLWIQYTPYCCVSLCIRVIDSVLNIWNTTRFFRRSLTEIVKQIKGRLLHGITF